MKNKDLLEECLIMLKLAISMAERSGYETEHYQKTIDKINLKIKTT